MRRFVPLLAALALLVPPPGTALAASPPSQAVQGPIGCTVLSQGDHGFPVRVLQGDLAQFGLFRGAITGVFGTTTTTALKRFQLQHGLSATGSLDAATLAAIKQAMHITGGSPNCGSTGGASTGGGSPTPAPSQAVQGPIGCVVLSQGDHGFPVQVLQGDLKQLGLFSGTVTGVFGATTTAALQGFQRLHGLPATGVLDAATLAAIKQAMHITGAAPSCGTSSGSGSTSGNTGSGANGGSAGSTGGNGGSTSGGSGSTGSGSASGGTGSTGGGAPSSATVSPLSGIISPMPRLAIDYEYTWITPGFPLTGSCSAQSNYGAWDAKHGYAGIVLDLGNPLGLQSRIGLSSAEARVRTAEQCFTQGFTSAAPHDQPLIYVGFSNCVGSCNGTSTSTATYQRAGTVAAEYVASGTANVKGVWMDVESDWSTLGAVHAMVLGYLSVNPATRGHGQYCDSTYRNYASGLPNNTWTVGSMVNLYVSPLLNAGYTCLGSQRLLIPQAYAASWLTNGSANFSPTSALAKYVGGITVCGAVESAGRCPDLGIPSGSRTKWYDYAHDGYAPASSSVVAVVGGGALKISV